MVQGVAHSRASWRAALTAPRQRRPWARKHLGPSFAVQTAPSNPPRRSAGTACWCSRPGRLGSACLSRAACGMLHVARHAACGTLRVARCACLHVARCMCMSLHVARGTRHAACYMWHAACGMLPAACCMWQRAGWLAHHRSASLSSRGYAAGSSSVGRARCSQSSAAEPMGRP